MGEKAQSPSLPGHLAAPESRSATGFNVSKVTGFPAAGEADVWVLALLILNRYYLCFSVEAHFHMGSSVCFMTQSFESSCLGIALPWGTPACPGSRAGLGEAVGRWCLCPCHRRIRNYSTAWGLQVHLTTPSPVVGVCGPCSLRPGGGCVSVELGLCAGRDVTRRLLPESPPEAKLDFGLRNPFTDVSVFLPHM